LKLPEDGCSFQPKHTGAIKPTVQLAGHKLAWILACILLSLWSRATIFFHGVLVPHSMPITITTNPIIRLHYEIRDNPTCVSGFSILLTVILLIHTGLCQPRQSAFISDSCQLIITNT